MAGAQFGRKSPTKHTTRNRVIQKVLGCTDTQLHLVARCLRSLGCGNTNTTPTARVKWQRFFPNKRQPMATGGDRATVHEDCGNTTHRAPTLTRRRSPSRHAHSTAKEEPGPTGVVLLDRAVPTYRRRPRRPPFLRVESEGMGVTSSVKRSKNRSGVRGRIRQMDP